MLEDVTGLGAILTTSELVVLHVTLSVLVTAHVLMRKREIGAAIGWIGLS